MSKLGITQTTYGYMLEKAFVGLSAERRKLFCLSVEHLYHPESLRQVCQTLRKAETHLYIPGYRNQRMLVHMAHETGLTASICSPQCFKAPPSSVNFTDALSVTQFTHWLNLLPTTNPLVLNGQQATPLSGGWHRVNAIDQSHAMFSLLAALPVTAKDQATWDSALLMALRVHPVYPVFTFLSEMNPNWSSASMQTFIRVVSELMDMRWFVDPSRPNRSDLLKLFMGLVLGVTDSKRLILRTHEAELGATRSGRAKAWLTALGIRSTLPSSVSGKEIDALTERQVEGYLDLSELQRGPLWPLLKRTRSWSQDLLTLSLRALYLLRQSWLDQIYVLSGRPCPGFLDADELFSSSPDTLRVWKTLSGHLSTKA